LDFDTWRVAQPGHCRFHRASLGATAGFLFLAAVAAAAFGILSLFTLETRDKQFLNSTPGTPSR